ncbi:MAG TPA: hypothetical protein VL500_06190 [Candidatus Eisenbacteria bacterium]|nr:hypothetical protein [Candidatus Eisenbacteria bacterium]
MFRQGLELVAHPLRKVCYEPLAAHYHKKYRSKYPVHHSKVLILDLALLFVMGGLVVFWIFANSILPLFPVPALVSLEVLAPTTLVSGVPTDFVIAYQNDSPQTLGCAELRIRLPENTVLEQPAMVMDRSEKTCYVDSTGGHALGVDPNEPDMHVILLGNIDPNGRDAVRFKARSYGPTGSTKVMTAEMLYWEEAATVPARIATRDEWQVTGSALGLDLSMPDNASRGQRRTIVISYENRGLDDLSGTVVRLSSPEDFTISGSEPSAAARGEWRLGTLAPGQKGRIVVYGYFHAVAGPLTAPTFAARGYVMADGKLTLAELVRKNADPGAADVEFTQEITAPAGREALEPGQEVTVKISYRNAGKGTIKNMSIVLDPGADLVVNKAPETLTWDPSTRPELAEIAPGAEGVLTATFAVAGVITSDMLAGASRPALHLSSRAHYVTADDPDHEVRLDTPVRDLAIATRLEADAAALYFTKDGDQLGIGPLPPKAGETTKYRVFLTVTNTTGDAGDVSLEAYLPTNVVWTGHASVTAGDALDYFPSTGRVRWNIGRVPAFAGDSGDRIGATFEVAITPDKSEIGSAPLLVKGIKLIGKDAVTGLPLHAAAEDLTTDLPYDQRAAGKGTVVK